MVQITNWLLINDHQQKLPEIAHIELEKQNQHLNQFHERLNYETKSSFYYFLLVYCRHGEDMIGNWPEFESLITVMFIIKIDLNFLFSQNIDAFSKKRAYFLITNCKGADLYSACRQFCIMMSEVPTDKYRVANVVHMCRSI